MTLTYECALESSDLYTVTNNIVIRLCGVLIDGTDPTEKSIFVGSTITSDLEKFQLPSFNPTFPHAAYCATSLDPLSISMTNAPSSYLVDTGLSHDPGYNYVWPSPT